MKLKSPQQRERRRLTLALEHANNGRYATRQDQAATGRRTLLSQPKPFLWLLLPEAKVSVFAADGDPRREALLSRIRGTWIEGDQRNESMVLIPVHWEEASDLYERDPSLRFVEDGEVVRGSSPRSVFMPPDERDGPQLLRGLDPVSVKMGLGPEAYRRLGGLSGWRIIDQKDAQLAPVFTHVFCREFASLSLLEVQAEAIGSHAKFGPEDTLEVGALLRTVSEGDIPGFALFSPSSVRLPYAPGTARKKGACLGSEALRFAMSKDKRLDRTRAILELFVDPLLEVTFSLFVRGFAMELHPQNFLLRFDERTGLTSKVVVRDLHGLNYSAEWRAAHGLDDVLTADALRPQFPQLTQAQLDAWFRPEGTLRERFIPPDMFGKSLDFFTSIFWFQLLDALSRDGVLDRAGVDATVRAIQDRVSEKARAHGFDLSQLRAPNRPEDNYWAAHAAANGIRGKVVFRR